MSGRHSPRMEFMNYTLHSGKRYGNGDLIKFDGIYWDLMGFNGDSLW